MKKLFVAFLCLVMLLSVVACDKKGKTTTTTSATTPITTTTSTTTTTAPSKTAAELVQEAYAKLTPAKGVDFSMVVTGTEDGLTETIATKDMKFVLKEDGTLDFDMNDVDGTEITTGCLVDGIVYLIMEGQKVKMTATPEMLESLDMGDIAGGDTGEVDQTILDALEGITPALVDGKYTLTYTLTGNAVISALNGHLYFSDWMGEIEGIHFTDYQGTIVIDADGNVVSETISFSVYHEDYPEDVMSYGSVMTYNNPGQQVVVTPPADADAYFDLDAFQ